MPGTGRPCRRLCFSPWRGLVSRAGIWTLRVTQPPFKPRAKGGAWIISRVPDHPPHFERLKSRLINAPTPPKINNVT